MVPQRVRTHDGKASPRRIKPVSQVRVTGSDGYPDPTAPMASMAASLWTFAKMLAAPQMGKLASALGCIVNCGIGQPARCSRLVSLSWKAGIPLGLHGASMIT